MDVALQQFLRDQRPAVRRLVEQAALAVNSYFARLPLESRGELCERYTDLIIQSVLQGYAEREKVQVLVNDLAVLGILSSELLAQVTQIVDDLDNYIRHQLVGDPETREMLLRRLHQAYGSLVPKLTANLLDQQFPRTAGGRPIWSSALATGGLRPPGGAVQS
jgi:hypothetical protein